jgi:predicted tellurium resistance membrane protein TerC
MIELLSNPDTWVSLLTLTLLEIVLGIDNVVFISILTSKLPPSQQKRGRNTGLLMALGMRILLLLGIAWIVGMTTPLFEIANVPFTGRDLILLGGGLFLLYKSVVELHEKMEVDEHGEEVKEKVSFKSVIIQILMIDLVFSLDSIITAVGLVDHVEIMIAAVVIAMMVMIAFAHTIAEYINKRPTLKVLALSFLILIGFMLVFEGLHNVHHQEIPKGYAYFAMAFAFGVELLNLRIRPKVLKKTEAKRKEELNKD